MNTAPEFCAAAGTAGDCSPGAKNSGRPFGPPPASAAASRRGYRAGSCATAACLLGLLVSFAEPFGVLTGTLGSHSTDGFGRPAFAYSLGLYAKFDDQTLLGLESGQGSGAGGSSIPLLGSAIIRLPLGRVVLPVAKAEFGYAFADSLSGLAWRLGGGADIKNGRRSSLLALAGYERIPELRRKAAWFARFGILLEW